MEFFLLSFMIFTQISFGQKEFIKIDTIFSSKGIAHKVINIKSKNKLNHLQLALECKEKADSLLQAHFDFNFFDNNIFLDAESSAWYNVNNNSRATSLLSYKEETPKKVELVYSILDKNSDFFNLIEVTLKCENEIKIINFRGVPKSKNYKINIDYKKAKSIALKKGFKNNFSNRNYSVLKNLSLHFDDKNNYHWVAHKNIKRSLSKQVGVHSSIVINSKALFINAETGKTKVKKIKKYVGHVYWY